MGLLDKFRKNKEQENIQNEPREQKVLPFEVEFKMLDNGLMQIDFFDREAEFKQFYDTTRLVVNPVPLQSYGDDNVLNCKVSWYGQSDAQILGEGKEIGRRVQYKGILAQIDLNLLRTDPEYCNMVMKGLLDKERVEKYLDRGLEENPEMPCGKYIGGVKKHIDGIMQMEEEYRKVFDRDIGMQSHYSDLMVNRRREYREKQEMRRQQQIEDRRKQIEKLQSEIDSMEGR